MPQHLTNYSTGTRTYLYHPKEGGPKGANRLCTVLYHEIRRVKHSDHRARFARTLYLVADNAADNKNTDVIAFCCELVSRKWFDSVEFAFGEVGHTHNGEDAAHHVLNECVGRHVALTLGLILRSCMPSRCAVHLLLRWKCCGKNGRQTQHGLDTMGALLCRQMVEVPTVSCA